MNSALKWVLALLAVLAVAAICIALYARTVVNFPAPGGAFDPVRIESQIVVPEGFSIGAYASDVANARMLLFTTGGDLLVATPNLGKVVLLERDRDRDGKADGKRDLMVSLKGPNGLDFHEGWLYIAETDAIGRIAFDHASGSTSGTYERVVTGLPSGGNHWQKTLRFGPDGLMYVTIGSSCNVCIEEDARRGTMMRYQPDGSGEEIFATGLRNSAGFDFSPTDNQVYATDNGRDMLGDDFPPCELNRVSQGNHYGWPFANGARVPDPDFGPDNGTIIERSVAPVHEFRAHNAPLGIQFIRGHTLPEKYRGSALVALHGSWNRSVKDGYKVVSLHFDEAGGILQEDFVSGFLLEDDVIGRPVELEEGPDGAIYISDDYAGAVYRVAYRGAQPSDAGGLALISLAERAQVL